MVERMCDEQSQFQLTFRDWLLGLRTKTDSHVVCCNDVIRR